MDARMAGYRCALHCRGLVELSLPTDIPLREFLEQKRPDGIVCANDLTAARLMHDLLKMGIASPRTSAWSA